MKTIKTFETANLVKEKQYLKDLLHGTYFYASDKNGLGFQTKEGTYIDVVFSRPPENVALFPARNFLSHNEKNIDEVIAVEVSWNEEEVELRVSTQALFAIFVLSPYSTHEIYIRESD